MNNARKAVIISAFILFSALSVSAADLDILPLFDPLSSRPGPQLLYPLTDTIIPDGQDFLEFRWLDTARRVDHFVFKIYTGFNMYARDLVYQQRVAAKESSVKIRSELLEPGRVYTWSLIRVSWGGQKSEKSFSSFKIIKK